MGEIHGFVAWPESASMGSRAVGAGGTLQGAIDDAARRGYPRVKIRPVSGRRYESILDYLATLPDANDEDR